MDLALTCVSCGLGVVVWTWRSADLCKMRMASRLDMIDRLTDGGRIVLDLGKKESIDKKVKRKKLQHFVFQGCHQSQY